MVERRSVVTAIILTIVTCGIYGIYWFIVLNNDVNTLSGTPEDTSGGMAFLFSIITCGIYTFFWMYKMGTKLDNIETQRGAYPQSRGIVYLLLSLFGLSIVSYALMQDSVNRLA